MWVIDENAIIDLSFVWFIPIIAPVIALMHGIIMKVYEVFIINIIIDSGASFCQVDKIIHEIHESDVITEGNHTWHGTIPNFRIRDIRSINSIIDFLKYISVHIEEDIINKILDPSAWTRKYLSIASDSWNLLELFISGINDNILISIAVHVSSQLFLEIAISDLKIMIIYIRMENGEMLTYMKDLMDLNHQI